MVGTQVKRFRILAALGSDGLTESWAAVHEAGLKVLLKTLRTELRDDQQIRRAFTEELSLAIHLDHPGVARIIELGSDFVAYEASAGKTLREILERTARQGGALSTWFGLRVAASAAQSLQHLHALTDERGERLGVLHRGLRPETIGVSPAGQVKLLELGLARASALAPGAWSDGKLAYLAPEQARGSGTDRRSDLYSLGLCVYELLTGVQPFRSGDDREVLHRVLAGNPPPLRQLAPSIPAPVERVIMRALSVDPAARHPDAAFLAAELSALLETDLRRDRELGRVVEELFPEEPIEVAHDAHPEQNELVSEQQLTPVHLTGPDLRPALRALPEPPRLKLVPAGSEPAVRSSFVERTPVRQSTGTAYLVVGDRTPVRQGASAGERTPVRQATGPAWDALVGRRPTGTEPAAPSRPDEGPVRAAAESFDRGLELLLGGAYDAALAEWEQAVALTPGNRLYQSNLVRLRRMTAQRGR